MQQILELLLSFEPENISLAELLAKSQQIDIPEMLNNLGLNLFKLTNAAAFLNYDLEINCSGSYIQNLSPLLWLKNLEEIIAANNKISELIPLDKFERLRGINVNRNQLQDISLLTTGLSLEYAHFSHNKISCIPDLEPLKKLKYLGFNNNTIQDISPLYGLRQQLQVLYLEHNQIEDISILAEFGDLHTLYIADNPIADYSHLSKIKRLETLHLGRSSAVDFSFLLNLTGLKICFMPKTSSAWSRKLKKALPKCAFY